MADASGQGPFTQLPQEIEHVDIEVALKRTALLHPVELRIVQPDRLAIRGNPHPVVNEFAHVMTVADYPLGALVFAAEQHVAAPVQIPE